MVKRNYSGCIWNLGLTSSLIIGGMLNSTTVVLFNISPQNLVLAQIIPDQTLGAESSVINPNVDIKEILSDKIEGGAIRGSNLFHSFKEFNVREGQGAYFANPVGIKHILSRVTGNSVSEILGKLGVLGNADLFLINPNGIVFGPSATLDLKGSFLATTANSLIFEDGTQFSATETSGPPLLSISIPGGLQFRETTGSILNQSQILRDDNGSILRLGLELQPGNTLALVGGNITFEGGVIAVPRGRIELGSVGRMTEVRLQQIQSGWALSYEGVQNFQDIEVIPLNNQPSLTTPLSLLSTISIDGRGGGSIQLQGRRVSLANGSQIIGAGASIVVSASETLQISGTTSDGSFPRTIPSAIGSISPLTGNSGSVILNSKKLIVQDGGRVTSDTNGFAIEGPLKTTTVPGGNLIINASESIELDGNGESLTGLVSRTESFGAAGNIIINTGKLIIRDGAIISAESTGVDLFEQPIKTGQAGNININVAESLELNGGFISTETRGLGGDGGNLRINTGNLNVIDGGRILASTTGEGRGGNIFVNTSDFANISGFDDESASSGLFAQSDSTGVAGNVTINAPQLTLQEEGQITVSSLFSQAGNLTINANSLSLNRGSITAETGKSGTEGANILLQISDQLILSNESLISATANGDADGGNININTPLLTVFPPTGPNGSDIIANAERGTGGNITINAQGIFGIAEGLAIPGNQTNDIDASSEFGASGQVEINSTIDPNRGVVQLPETVVDPNALVAQNPCKRGSQSQFTRTGRGGLPPSLNEDLSSEATQVGLVEPAPMNTEKPESREVEEKKSSAPSGPTSIVPAQGWVFNDQGEIVLVAYDPTVTGPQRLKEKPAGCPEP